MVDTTLAHGRARWLCDQLGARIEAAKGRGRPPPATLPSERKAAAVLDSIGNGWGTLALADWRPAPAERVWWLLGSARDYLEVRAVHIGYRRARRNEYRHLASSHLRLRLNRHTIARLLQRQSRLDIRALHDELQLAVHAFAPLFFASRKLRLQRFALPTATGLLVGDVGERLLIARSWYSSLNGEYRQLRAALASLDPERAPVEAGAIAVALAAPEATPSAPLLDGWCSTLAGFPSLKERFVPAPDPAASFWELAPGRQAT